MSISKSLTILTESEHGTSFLKDSSVWLKLQQCIKYKEFQQLCFSLEKIVSLVWKKLVLAVLVGKNSKHSNVDIPVIKPQGYQLQL